MNFKKFMNDILKRETEHKSVMKDRILEEEELPQRRYNKLYREHWQNSVYFRRKNERHKN
tara:strand:+ start:627 stop:806 length:180 start_codon:yes stop_codon:yes gene_type:complete